MTGQCRVTKGWFPPGTGYIHHPPIYGESYGTSHLQPYQTALCSSYIRSQYYVPPCLFAHFRQHLFLFMGYTWIMDNWPFDAWQDHFAFIHIPPKHMIVSHCFCGKTRLVMTKAISPDTS